MKITSILAALSFALAASAVPQKQQGGFGGGRGGAANANAGKNAGQGAGKGANTASSATPPVASTAANAGSAAGNATGAAAGGKGGAVAAGGNGAAAAGGKGGAAAGGDIQKSLTLDPSVIATGFANNGQNPPVAGQVASLTSTNNFINFCAGKTITNGKQITGGSCNPAPIGDIPSTAAMPSSKFAFPANGGNVAANTQFTIKMNIKNLVTGNFVNAAANYFAAPQQLQGGQILGHSHVVVEALTAVDQGLNDKAANGVLTADVTAGLPAGAYRLCSINSSSNHQPVIVPIAQHGSLDDCVYFTSGGAGAAAGGAAAGGAAAGGANAGTGKAGGAGAAAGGANAGTGKAATPAAAAGNAAASGQAAAAGTSAAAGKSAAAGNSAAAGQAAAANAGAGGKTGGRNKRMAIARNRL